MRVLRSRHPFLGVDEFFKIFPVEILEHVISFCAISDLLRLTETCTTFRDILSQNAKLMKSLRLKIDFEVVDYTAGEKYFEGLGQCLATRSVTAVKISNFDYYETNEANKRIKMLLSIVPHCSRIVELEICSSKFTQPQLQKVIGIFLPNLQKCRLSHILTDSYFRLPTDPTRYASLTELSVRACDPVLCYEFLRCPHLKRLSSHGYDFFDGDPTFIEKEPFWRVANFMLQSFEIFNNISYVDESFLDFLRGQTELEEFSCAFDSDEFVDQVCNVLLQLPSLNQIKFRNSSRSHANIKYNNMTQQVNMSVVHHAHLSKFKVWTKWSSKTSKPKFIYLVYGSDAPEDINAFERDVLAFFDRDTDLPGVKHSDIIKALTIGKQSWREAGIMFSQEFISSLVQNLPNLVSLEVNDASCPNEMWKIVASKNFYRNSHFR